MVLSRYTTRGLLVCTTTICAAVLNLKGRYSLAACSAGSHPNRRDPARADEKRCTSTAIFSSSSSSRVSKHRVNISKEIYILFYIQRHIIIRHMGY